MGGVLSSVASLCRFRKGLPLSLSVNYYHGRTCLQVMCFWKCFKVLFRPLIHPLMGSCFRCCWYLINKWFSIQLWILSFFTNRTLDIFKYRPVPVNEHEARKEEQLNANLAEIKGLKEEIETLHRDFTDRSVELKKVEQKCECINREKEDALRRLSEIMSSQLRNNNPNIVDLSDEFRPTKLAEMSSELYDNEWTTAYSYLEDVTGTQSDEKFIQLLLNILMESYTLAKQIHNKEWQGLLKCIYGTEQNPSQENAKQLKDLKKKFAVQRLREIETACVGHLSQIFLQESSYFGDESFRRYVQGCVKLAWLMQIQDPPIVFQCNGWVSKITAMRDDITVGISGTPCTSRDQLLTWQHPTHASIDNDPRGPNSNLGDIEFNADGISSGPDAAFNENRPDALSYVTETETGFGKSGQISFDKGLYREYTKRGRFVDFIVWPVMYLHRDGPILSKGVAQGCK